jgi:hypothetical protein
VLTKARRARYLLFLSRNGVQNPTSVPLSVATRWNSWFGMAFYVNDHYQYLRNFYLEEQKNDSNETIENLVKIFNDTTNNCCVQIYLSFIKIYAQKFINDLNFFQQENLPLFPFVEGRLEQLGVYINNGMSMENFDQTLITLIQNLNFAPESFYPIFRSAYEEAFKKFRDHILNNPCREFFKAVQLFDPKFITLTSNRDILSYSTFITEFANPSLDLIQEWVIYCNFDLSLIEYSNLEEFWKKVSHHHLPLLSQIALDYIWIPISSCSVERSFSVYNNILGEDRENLSQDSLRMLNTLYFNRM